jgi:uncharacterized protein YbjQ (UPF0145 family)
MQRQTLPIIAATLLLFSGDASARTTIHYLDVADVLNNSEYASRLQGVSFYFGNTPHPAPIRTIGERRTNQKTNAFNKSDIEACEWVMLSALIAMRKAAINAGANAIVNIRSNFKSNLFVSDTQYSCGAGSFVAGVALIGDLIEIE